MIAKGYTAALAARNGLLGQDMAAVARGVSMAGDYLHLAIGLLF